MSGRCVPVLFLSAVAIVMAGCGQSQDAIRVGFPMTLSGAGALFGEPTVQGARMFVDEVNARGGVLGRKLELVVRDTKGNADEAVRVSRELILRENVDFLVGTLSSAEGPAVSPVARENEVLFIAPITKADSLTAPGNLHPYVIRTASTTQTEGRSAAEILARWTDVRRVATMGYDYAYGQEVTQAFLDHLRKIRPDIELVDQQWPKLTEQDYTPFINAQLSRRPDAVFSSLWGGGFLTFAKQAKPLRYFDALQFRFVGAGEAGSIESAQSMGADYPVGIWANAYDVFHWKDGAPAAHGAFIDRLKAYTKTEYPSSWPLVGYMGMQALVAGIEKAGVADAAQVARVMPGLSYETPIGTQTIGANDHSANRGQFWGRMIDDPQYPFPVMSEIVYMDPAKFVD